MIAAIVGVLSTVRIASISATGKLNTFPVFLTDSPNTFRGSKINAFNVKLLDSPNTFKSITPVQFPINLNLGSGIASGKSTFNFPVTLVSQVNTLLGTSASPFRISLNDATSARGINTVSFPITLKNN